jgi:hypothetical protein
MCQINSHPDRFGLRPTKPTKPAKSKLRRNAGSFIFSRLFLVLYLSLILFWPSIASAQSLMTQTSMTQTAMSQTSMIQTSITQTSMSKPPIAQTSTTQTLMLETQGKETLNSQPQLNSSPVFPYSGFHAISLKPIAVSVVSLLLAFILARRGNKENYTGKSAAIGRSLARNNLLELSPIVDLFPGQWLRDIDPIRLEKWLQSVKRLTIEKYLSALSQDKPHKMPGPQSVEAAKEKLALTLNQALTSSEAFAIFSPEKPLPIDQTNFLISHLNDLLPKMQIPLPQSVAGRSRLTVMALIAAIGGVAGNILGGGILHWLGQPAATGALIGSGLGAALLVGFALFLLQNEKYRKIVLAAVGGLALLDSLAFILKGGILPSWFGGQKSSWFKRLFFYSAAILALLLMKNQIQFDLGDHRREVEKALDAYLKSFIPIMLILMYRSEENLRKTLTSDQAELLLKVAGLVKKLSAKPGASENLLLSELSRKLTNAGFEMSQDVSGKPMVWDEGLKELYDTFGYIKNGQKVIIEEEPIFKDGKVVKKGQAVLE